MPKTKFQEVIFTFIMVFFMVYAMICYNISLSMGHMQDKIFLLAFHELIIMGPIAYILDFFIVAGIAKKCAFRVVNPQTSPVFHIILAISAISVLFMCPLMSLAATILFKRADAAEFGYVSTWVETTIKNFPMAFFWQIFFAGPVVRRIFGLIFREKRNIEETQSV